MLTVYSIVEGHSEVYSVPILLRRFAHEVFEVYDFRVLPPYRLPKGRMVAGPHLESAVAFGRRKLDLCDGRQAILIVCDADDDCPGQTAPELLEWVAPVAAHIPVSVVFAKAEYESWLLAAVQSLRGHSRMENDSTAPQNPEAIRGAKEYLERRCMMSGATYSPTIDQPALTQRFSFEEARQACPSFDKAQFANRRHGFAMAAVRQALGGGRSASSMR